MNDDGHIGHWVCTIKVGEVANSEKMVFYGAMAVYID
jgi:hypothetical protein